MKLVLLPGMDGTGRLFEPLIDELPTAIEPVVISYPGDRALDFTALQGFVRQELPVDEPYTLLGESFSGPIAIALAAENPANLQALILVASYMTCPSRSLKVFRRLLPIVPTHGALVGVAGNHLLGAESPALRQSVHKALAAVTPAVIRCRLAITAKVDVSAETAKVAVPVLYLRAADDKAVPAKSGAEISMTAPDATVVSVNGPHLLLQHNPRDCSHAISQFLGVKD